MSVHKIKYRLMAAFILLAIFPAIPLSFLFQSMMEKVFNLGFSHRMESALDDGIRMSRTLLQNEKRIHIDNSRQILEQSRVRNFLVKSASKTLSQKEFQQFFDETDLSAYKVDGFAVFDGHQRLFQKTVDERLASIVNDPDLITEIIKTQAIVSEYREQEKVLVTGIPYFFANQKPGALTSVVYLKKELAGQFENILAVFQFYKTFGLERQAITQSFLFAFLTVYLLIILISITIAIFFSTAMTRPIRELVYGTDQISQGNLDYQIAIEPRQDEIGRLMNSFNRMVTNVKQQQQRLLFLEKMATWREIAQRLAHEIKNPLTPIQLTIQQLKDSYRGDDERYKKILNDCYEIVQEEIESLRNLTKEFSEFARMPALTFKPTDIGKLVRDVAALYGKIPTELNIQENVPSPEADPDALKRVLINLLDNASAVLSNKTDAKIVIRLQCENDLIQLTIADNGSGIPQENLSRIFEPHFSTKSTGMGLGLAITKNIIEEHRGSISVESVENLGTTFLITLPINRNIF